MNDKVQEGRDRLVRGLSEAIVARLKDAGATFKKGGPDPVETVVQVVGDGWSEHRSKAEANARGRAEAKKP
jgi:hypothetical protein